MSCLPSCYCNYSFYGSCKIKGEHISKLFLAIPFGGEQQHKHNVTGTSIKRAQAIRKVLIM